MLGALEITDVPRRVVLRVVLRVSQAVSTVSSLRIAALSPVRIVSCFLARWEFYIHRAHPFLTDSHLVKRLSFQGLE